MSKSKNNLKDFRPSSKYNSEEETIDDNPIHNYLCLKKAFEVLSSLNLMIKDIDVSDDSNETLAELLNRTVNETIYLLMKVKPQRISTQKFGAEENALKTIIEYFLGRNKKEEFINSYNETHTKNSFVFDIDPDQLKDFNNISLNYVHRLIDLYKENKRRYGQFYRRKSFLDFFKQKFGGKRSRRFNTKKRRTRQRK